MERVVNSPRFDGVRRAKNQQEEEAAVFFFPYLGEICVQWIGRGHFQCRFEWKDWSCGEGASSVVVKKCFASSWRLFFFFFFFVLFFLSSPPNIHFFELL